MHPVLAEIIACKDTPRTDVLRRWQQQLRDVIAPLVAKGELADVYATETTAPARRSKAGQ